MTTKLMGEKVQRVEDDRLLRGEGRYVDDLMPGALELAVLRSPHAHARIVDIENLGLRYTIYAQRAEHMLAPDHYSRFRNPVMRSEPDPMVPAMFVRPEFIADRG